MTRPNLIERLKPCPFCGEGDAFVERADYSSCYVICNDCGTRGPTSCNENDEDCAAEEAGMEPGENAARRLWNTRTNDPTLTAEVEELRAALEPFSEASEAIGAAWGPDLPLAACRGFTGNILMVRDLRRARATLTKGEGRDDG